MATCIQVGCAAQACFRDLIFLGNCRGESESSAFPDSERYRWLEMLRTPTKRKKDVARILLNSGKVLFVPNF